MKKSTILALICFCYSLSYAQSPIVAQHNEKGLFVSHTVAAKETFYSIGRTFNVPAKDIAAFNSLDMAAGLPIGKVIKVPLNNTNFSQDAVTGTPVYYTVGAKEGLYRVSVNNNKVLMANLRKWNNLATDNITPGQKLIVGYLLSQQAPAVATITPVETKKVEEAPKTEVIQKPHVQEKEVVQQKVPVQLEERPVKTVSNPVSNVEIAGIGGYFKSQFSLQQSVQPTQKDETLTAGVFKTASGWTDAKYYALLDNVEPGTIVRIINPSNNKSIYAKVLDKMTGIRQNQGYDVRISSAAASALQVEDTDKFFLRVNY